MNQEIIVAIATSRLEAAISMLRISGEGCIEFVSKFFTGNINHKETHTITYGYLMDGDTKIDEVMVSIYRGTKTFTGEEMVEISCHGGVFITNKVLELCIKKGAKHASRGEFSKRAFFNGRIDLSQAEAISDLITSSNSIASTIALNGIQGSTRNFVEDLKEDLIKIITQIEVTIDYPEYDDVEELTANSLLPKSVLLLNKMDKILNDSKNINIIKDGIKTAIIGRPNVGKSSLLNAFLKQNKAIVSDVAGTTRDIVEGTVRLDDIVLQLVDTAGIHETIDNIESMGIDKAKALIEEVDLILLVLDGSMDLTKSDEDLLELTKEKVRIIVYNKNDIVKNIEGISISAKNHDIQSLVDKIKEMFDFGHIIDNQKELLSNARQVELFHLAKKYLNQAVVAMEQGVPIDLIVEDMTTCWLQLQDIVGKRSKEDLLDELFKRFCIGK